MEKMMKETIFQVKESTECMGMPDTQAESKESKESKQANDSKESARENQVHTSLWSASCIGRGRVYHEEELPEHTDALVIGGGMAGMLIGYQLQALGIDPIIVDSGEIGHGVTANTTAKLTSLHGPVYSKIVKQYGEENAKLYYEIQQASIFSYSRIIASNQIDCGYEEHAHIMFTTSEERKLEKEYEYLKQIGIPAVWVNTSHLPFAIRAGIEFRHQAQFHPLKFLHGVQKIVRAFPNCKVTKIDSDGEVVINGRRKINANFLIIATHFPMINSKGFYFVRMHQERSYVLSLRQPGGFRLNSMYIDLDPQGFTFRPYGDQLIFGKGNHRSGEKKLKDYYQELENCAAQWYPKAEIQNEWSNQDCMTLDGIPYIGRYSEKLPNIYVATGFNQWGMTNSMVAAKVIGDLIAYEKSEYAKVFSPNRHQLGEVPKLLVNGAVTSVAFTKELFQFKEDKIAQIKPGEAGIIELEGHTAGVYRDESGTPHYVDTRCPHLGCRLEWNPLEKTWDCPCHGSRFDYDGNLIEDPAEKDISRSCSLHKKNN